MKIKSYKKERQKRTELNERKNSIKSVGIKSYRIDEKTMEKAIDLFKCYGIILTK